MIENAAEELLRYTLFTDEARLEGPVRGGEQFLQDFEAAGRRDSRGRSLRDLDLDSRLLRYPCSYMIDSESIEALPAPAKQHFYRRLWQVLTGKDQSPEFQSLSPKDRRAILEILQDTKTDLPGYWRSSD
jgi:hypothetical protein